MFGTFRRPVGASADAHELEYVSALHQTSSVIHTDGTISAQDVIYFLRSRYGLDITSEDAIDMVRGLAGTSRLPLPQVEKKVWRRNDQKAAKEQGAPHHKVPKNLRKRRCKCCKSADDEDEEDELAALEAQLKSLQESKTDTRRGWEFPALQRQIHRQVPKNVTSLVRYDMVQMMSILLIPSILRVERYRFKEEKEAPPPRAPLFAGYLSAYTLLWHSSKMARRIIKAPVTLVQRARQKRLTKLKESLQPKPDTLILDVLRIMLGSLEERDSPVTKIGDFAAPRAASTSTGTTTTGTGKGRHFPELRETVVSKDLIQRILEYYQQDKASQDDDLIEQMMNLVGGEGAILDERAFAHALTSDVTRWPLECEDDVTSTFYDVYGFGPVDCNEYAKELTPEELLADTHRSTPWSPLGATKMASDDDSSSSSSDSSFHSAEMEWKDIENGIKNEYAKIYASRNSSQSAETVDSENTSNPVKTTDSEMTKRSSSQQAALSAATSGGKPLKMGKIPVFKPTTGYIDYACDSVSLQRFSVIASSLDSLVLT